MSTHAQEQELLEQELSAPFDFDAPNMVWCPGCSFSIPKRVLPLSSPRACPFFLTEADAWEFRARFAQYIKSLEGVPKKYEWDYISATAQKKGIPLCILDGKGNEVCR